MNADEAQKHIREFSNSLVSKRRLLLTVDVRTENEAKEIMQWLYGDEKPMKASLVEVSWDKPLSTASYAELRETLKRVLDNA